MAGQAAKGFAERLRRLRLEIDMHKICIVWLLALAVWASQASGQSAPGEIFGIDSGPWTRLADRAETVINAGRASDAALLSMRSQIVAWRQDVENALVDPRQRLDRLSLQLDALGPEPESGEAQEVADRRAMLNEQIAELSGDYSIGSEIVRRADGLVEAIDALRQAQVRTRLLTLGPTPLNPLNWLDAFEFLADYANGLIDEVADALSSETQLRFAGNNALQSLFVAALGILLLSGFRDRMVRAATGRAARRSGAYSREWEFLSDFLTAAALPSIGFFLVVAAAETTGLYFIKGTLLLEALPILGLYVFGSRWLAGVAFGGEEAGWLSAGRDLRWRRSARLAAVWSGWVLGADHIVGAVADSSASGPVTAVLQFPIILAGSIVLVKIGRLLGTAPARQSGPESGTWVRDKVSDLIGKAAIVVGGLAAILSAVGYGAAAEYLLFPSIKTLFLLGSVSILTMLLGGIYLASTRKSTDSEHGGKSLFTAMIAVFLFLLALPVIAWLWGTTEEELSGVWEIAVEGVSIGGQRISVIDILTLVAVFMIGFALTRLAKGLLEGTILPNTRLDDGGRRAIATGTEYVGIFVALVVAVSLAGIDLTNLAIVAGALSVGIGFGLQAVVSNFVSGLILLIERPVNEGDWIVVGGVSGTVKRISVRSTTIETFDRANVVVPNSDLITSKVTNWTLIHRYGRSIIPVGVAYGTDPRKVESLLFQVAIENEKVMKNPEPQIIFAGFGDNSLDFELRVILVDVNYLLSAKSELNFAIAKKFEEEGIEIPFPQRDLWLRNSEEIGQGMRNSAGDKAEND